MSPDELLKLVEEARTAYARGSVLIRRRLCEVVAKQRHTPLATKPPLPSKKLPALRELVFERLDRLSPSIAELPSGDNVALWALGRFPYGRHQDLDQILSCLSRNEYPLEEVEPGLIEPFRSSVQYWFGLFAKVRYKLLPAIPRLTIDVAGCQITIDGKESPVSPHHAVILNALWMAKQDGSRYVTGPTMNNLPACKGKKISREIANLKQQIPALEEFVHSDRPKGYYMTE